MRRFLAALALIPLLAGAAFPVAHRERAPFASRPALDRELWRFSGHLVARGNRRFDFSVLFFRFRVARPNAGRIDAASRWSAADIYPAAASVVDENRAHVWSDRRIERGALGLAAASSQRLDVHVDDWHAIGNAAANNGLRVSFHGRIDGIVLAVRARARKPGLQLAATGRARSAPGCGGAGESVVTSLEASGSIGAGGAPLPVSGVSWLDHEYGDRFLCAGESGWDRFWVQLDDHREILIERVRSRKKAAVTTIAVLIDPSGIPRTLAASTYALFNDGGAHWRSRHTGALYPCLWGLTIPDAGLRLSLEPVTSDQELASSGVGASFWEGALDVYDVTPGTPGRRLGSAYAELTGYAEQPAL